MEGPGRQYYGPVGRCLAGAARPRWQCIVERLDSLPGTLCDILTNPSASRTAARTKVCAIDQTFTFVLRGAQALRRTAAPSWTFA